MKKRKKRRSKHFELTPFEKLLLKAQKARSSLYVFVKLLWKVVVRKHPFVDNWHIKAICDHLQAVTEGKIQNLLINVPPRHTKSLIVSVFWPAWEWMREPENQFLFCSKTQKISHRDSAYCRRVIQSREYQDMVGALVEFNGEKQKPVDLRGDQNLKSYYENTEGGARIATSAMSEATGENADRMVIDDLHGINDGSDLVDKQTEWADETFWSRGNWPEAPKVVIGQRVRENDISGHIISGQAGGNWVVLMFPMEYDSARHCRTGLVSENFPNGFEDPRTKDGELLWPERYDQETVDTVRERQPGKHARLNQQNPTPEEGGTFKKSWLEKRWQVIRYEDITLWGTSCDTPFRKGKNTDFYVHGLIAEQTHQTPEGKPGATDFFYIAQVRGRKEFEEMERDYEGFIRHWEGILGPGSIKKNLIEAKASGDGIMSKMATKIDNVVGFDPGRDSKELRFELAAPTFRAGHFHLPAVGAVITKGGEVIAYVDASFVPGFVHELGKVPYAAHDDQADTITQWILDKGEPEPDAAGGWDEPTIDVFTVQRKSII